MGDTMKTAGPGRWNRHSSQVEEARNLWRVGEAFDQGRAALSELENAQNQLTRVFLGLEENIGIDAVSDGGFRWDSAFDISRKLVHCEGFKILHRIAETNHFHRAPEVGLAPVWREPILKSDLQFAKANTSKEILVSLAGPYTLARQSIVAAGSGIDLENLAYAYADALGKEIRELLNDGACAVKVDEPYLLLYPNDWDLINGVLRWLTLASDQNRVFLSTWFHPVNKFLNYFDLPFGGFFLDFTGGSDNLFGHLNVLKDFPANKILGAGMVDSRHPALAPIEDLLYWLRQILKRVPRENLWLTPSADLDFLPWDIAVLKLKQLVDLKKELGR